MTGMSNPESAQVVGFAVRADEQGLSAHLVRETKAALAEITADQLTAYVAAQKIAVDPDVQARVAEALRQWQAGADATEALIAQGRPPEHGRNGRVVWSARCDPDRPTCDEGDAFSHYASRLVTLSPGEQIAVIEPPTPAKPGVDVYGRPIEARAGAPAEVSLRSGCHLEDETGAIVADVPGTLHVRGNEIHVSEMLHIVGNVNFETGHVDAPGDVEIDGNVVDLFEVSARGNVVVHGEVQAACIRALGDVQIDRGLVNQRKGICLAGGSLNVRLIENSVVSVMGDIHVAREAVASDLFAGGLIDCSAGGICGGTAVGRKAVVAKTLGSDGGVRTIVAAGVDWMLDARLAPLAEELETLVAELDKRMPALTLLKANLKRLNPQQREQVTELEFQLMDLQTRREALERTMQALQSQSQELGAPEITVATMVYPGTHLRLGRVFANIEKAIHGPATFRAADVLGETVIVKCAPSGGRDPLPTRTMADPLTGITVPEMPPEPPAGGTDGEAST